MNDNINETEALEVEVRRSRRAKEVVENEEFTSAFEAIREGIIAQIEWGDDIDPEKSLTTLRLLNKIKGVIETTVVNGVVARDALKELTEYNKNMFGMRK